MKKRAHSPKSYRFYVGDPQAVMSRNRWTDRAGKQVLDCGGVESGGPEVAIGTYSAGHKDKILVKHHQP